MTTSKKQPPKRPRKPQSDKGKARGPKKPAASPESQEGSQTAFSSDIAEMLGHGALWKSLNPFARGRGQPSKLTPQLIVEEAITYFKWADDNPLMVAEYKQANGFPKMVHLPKARVYTMTGFHLHTRIKKTAFSELKKRLREAEESNYQNTLYTKAYCDAFHEAIHFVESVIETNKFEGASVGIFNPGFIGKSLGLADKVDHTSSDGSMTPNRTSLDDFYDKGASAGEQEDVSGQSYDDRAKDGTQ